MIGLIDYGLSNLVCVQSAINYLGYKTTIVKKHNELKNISKIILPGVGAFGDAIKNLKKQGLFSELEEQVFVKKKYFLGICLGAQLICKESEEFGNHKGFGWINASVRKIKSNDLSVRVPHSGWNNLILKKDDPILKEINEECLFYFTHSFGIFLDNPSQEIATCSHGENFSVIVNHKNIYGVQFHPEKSQQKGLELLSNFLLL